MILSTAGPVKSTVGLVNLTIGGIRPLLVSLQYFFGQVHSRVDTHLAPMMGMLFFRQSGKIYAPLSLHPKTYETA